MKALTNDYDSELAVIDGRIIAHKEQIRKLMKERQRLLKKLQDVDMDIVLQCIAEKGLTSKEVLELINSV